ncbi:MAG: hypothetical protein GY749_02050 [Desulfobacteraceae bacterium]|nr:hypothetical protein [Desulfobacteraceae bacterium]
MEKLDGLYYVDRLPVFKQLKPRQINAKLKKSGIYVLYRNRKNKAKVVYHSVENQEAHEESRTNVLNCFFEKLLTYFHESGLPFQHKELRMQSVDTIRGEKMRESQISVYEKSVYLVDDRIKPLIKPDNFIHKFHDALQTLYSQKEHDSSSRQLSLFGEKLVPDFVIRDKEDLKPGQRVLRVHDYEPDDFKDETDKNGAVTGKAVLKGWDDPYPIFYKKNPYVVKQSLNINPNSQAKKGGKKKRKEKRKSWTEDNYLEYEIVKPDETVIEVCITQLFLKDIVMHPQNVLSRLPQVRIMSNKIFMCDESLVYFDGTDLHFMPVLNNHEQASEIIHRLTGKDLVEDILISSMEKHYYNFSASEFGDKLEKTLKRRFIIAKDYIWEIKDSNERILYNDKEIAERFTVLDESKNVKSFYPQFPLSGNEPFNKEQLKEY